MGNISSSVNCPRAMFTAHKTTRTLSFVYPLPLSILSSDGAYLLKYVFFDGEKSKDNPVNSQVPFLSFSSIQSADMLISNFCFLASDFLASDIKSCALPRKVLRYSAP